MPTHPIPSDGSCCKPPSLRCASDADLAVTCSAEATDVANAVLDGVDGILLGAETLRGKYPVQTVETVLAICHQAEKVFDHHYHFENLMQVWAPVRACAQASRLLRG